MGCTRPAAIALPLLLSFVGAGARAADAPPASPLAEMLAASNIAVSGYLDVSYQHLGGTGQFATGGPDRVFDAREDSFTLHQASVTIARQPKEGFGAVLNLVAGQDADVFAPYDINPGAHSKFDFPQAYLQYATGSLTMIAGRFVTLAGYETIDPRTDTNFSRSILFGFAIPFTHTGVRTTFVPNDRVTLSVGIVNGWDDLKDTNSAKTVEFGVTLAPTKTLSLTADGYVGRERVGGLTPDGPEGQRKLLDLIASWSVTDALALVLNYDIGRQAQGAADGGTARWEGLAAYANYAFNDRWRASLRGEYLDDPDGYRTSVMQRWREVTLTVAWAPDRSFELRFEGRQDHSDHPAFVTGSAFFDNNPGNPAYLSHQQASVAVEGLYKF